MAWNEPGNNGRDPWGGGNRNDQGPPDLDEVVKKLQQGLNGLFGKSGGGSGGGPPRHVFRTSKPPFACCANPFLIGHCIKFR